MRAIQRAIVGVGLALVTVVAMALLVGGPRLAGPDSSDQPTQATGPRVPLVDVPDGPPEPVDAAEDTSVGTLPAPADASISTQQVSRDLLTPSGSAPSTRSPNARTPADAKPLDARKARAAKKDTKSPGQIPTTPEHDFAAAQDGWEWDGAESRYAADERDGDDCRRDRRDDCDDDRGDRRDDYDGYHDRRD